MLTLLVILNAPKRETHRAQGKQSNASGARSTERTYAALPSDRRHPTEGVPPTTSSPATCAATSPDSSKGRSREAYSSMTRNASDSSTGPRSSTSRRSVIACQFMVNARNVTREGDDMPNRAVSNVILPVMEPASLDGDTRQVPVEIIADHAITLNNATVTLTLLEARLQQVLASRRDKTVFVIGASSHAREWLHVISSSATGASNCRSWMWKTYYSGEGM